MDGEATEVNAEGVATIGLNEGTTTTDITKEATTNAEAEDGTTGTEGTEDLEEAEADTKTRRVKDESNVSVAENSDITWRKIALFPPLI